MSTSTDRPAEALRLTNSAETVVGTVREEAGFLARPDGALFVVLHQPADRPPAGWLIVCSSLFADQHMSYRLEVRLARMAASAGIAVARFHYRGHGNSAPASSSLDAFARDALDVTQAAQDGTPASQTAFLGVGAGSLVAATASLAQPKAPLLLWKPVVSGAQFFRDLFRARLVAATRLGEERPVSTDKMLTRLASEGSIDVMGFQLTASLYDSLSGSSLTEALSRQPRQVFVQPFRGARAAIVSRSAADWRAVGCLVDVQPTKLAENSLFIPDGADVAASILAIEEQVMANTCDWLINSWQSGK